MEIDGGQHTEAGDAVRTAVIVREGWMVLRFWNNEVLGNPDGVLETVLRVAKQRQVERGD